MFPVMFTRSLLLSRKSTHRMGKDTSTSRKSHSKIHLPPAPDQKAIGADEVGNLSGGVPGLVRHQAEGGNMYR